MRNSKPFPIVISGPSGVGKNTLLDQLLQQDSLLRRSISVTTRAPRGGEVEGEDYFFTDKTAFNAIKTEELVEWAEVHGYYYGTPRRFVEEQLENGYDPVLNIDVQGGMNVKKAFPNAVLVFILPPSIGDLEARIRGRGKDSESEIQKRLENARKEIQASSAYDYLVVNDTVERAVIRLAGIVEAERCKRERFLGSLTGEAGG